MYFDQSILLMKDEYNHFLCVTTLPCIIAFEYKKLNSSFVLLGSSFIGYLLRKEGEHHVKVRINLKVRRNFFVKRWVTR